MLWTCLLVHAITPCLEIIASLFLGSIPHFMLSITRNNCDNLVGTWSILLLPDSRHTQSFLISHHSPTRPRQVFLHLFMFFILSRNHDIHRVFYYLGLYLGGDAFYGSAFLDYTDFTMFSISLLSFFSRRNQTFSRLSPPLSCDQSSSQVRNSIQWVPSFFPDFLRVL